ncbi:MAG: glucosaminidase domain-containing protein [Pseudomonadota bacterium]
MSLIGGVVAVATMVVVAVQVTVPSESEIAAVGAEAGLPSLAPGVLNRVDSLVRPADSAHLEAVFTDLGYRLEDVRDGASVPRVYVTALPRDLADLNSVGERKALFLRTVLPLVLMSNQELENERAHLKDLAAEVARGESLRAADLAWIERSRERYDLPEDAGFAALLERIDVIPPSLALAQSIEESGWGTSRFARNGNALYGQRTWSPSIIGLVPDKRASKEKHRVRSYMNLMGGVRAYMHNLNSHPAYEDFRRKRAAQRAAGDNLDGRALGGTLLSYSERGQDYVDQIHGLMRTNGLAAFDGARLGGAVGDQQIAADTPQK